MRKLNLVGVFMLVLGSFSQSFAAQSVFCKIDGAQVNVVGTQVSVNGVEVKSSAEPKGADYVFAFGMNGKQVRLGVPAISEGFSGAVGVTVKMGTSPAKEIICNGRNSERDITY